MPNWIFTKTKKTETKKDTKKVIDFDPEVEKFIREKFSVSNRELTELKKFYPEKYSEWVESIADQINMSKK
jgi:DNA-binding transcriptional regulator YiaG